MYQVTVWSTAGDPLATLAPFGNIASARQAMLDHAGASDLPREDPWHSPAANVIEGWFIGRTEYLIGRYQERV